MNITLMDTEFHTLQSAGKEAVFGYNAYQNQVVKTTGSRAVHSSEELAEIAQFYTERRSRMVKMTLLAAPVVLLVVATVAFAVVANLGTVELAIACFVTAALLTAYTRAILGFTNRLSAPMNIPAFFAETLSGAKGNVEAAKAYAVITTLPVALKLT